MVKVLMVLLEVVWSSMSVKVWNLMVLSGHMSISVSVVVIPSMLWGVMLPISMISMSMAISMIPVSVVVKVVIMVVIVMIVMMVIMNSMGVMNWKDIMMFSMPVSMVTPWKIMSLKSMVNSDWWHEGWMSELVMVIAVLITVVIVIVYIMVWCEGVSSDWRSVVVLPVVWTNIWVVGFVNMNLSNFMVWLKVKVNSVMIKIMNWSVYMVWSIMTPISISVVGPVIIMMDRSVKQISKDWLVVSDIVVIIKIMMDWLIVTIS